MSNELEELQEKLICYWSKREKLVFVDYVNQANRQGFILRVVGKYCKYCGNLADTEFHLAGMEVPALGVIVSTCKECLRRADRSRVCRNRLN